MTTHKIAIGIDPGLSGAVAVIYPNGKVYVYDTPTIPVSKTKRDYHVAEMAELLDDIGVDLIAAIETQRPMPKQGVTSTFRTGYGFGLWQGILSALRIRYAVVRPQEWQRDVLRGQSGSGKGRTLAWAMRAYPDVTYTTPRGRHIDGRSDAVAIADYARRVLG